MILSGQYIRRPQDPANEDTTKARIYYTDGTVVTYDDRNSAFEIWQNLRKDIRAAFRGAGDKTPVHSWDYVDKI